MIYKTGKHGKLRYKVKFLILKKKRPKIKGSGNLKGQEKFTEALSKIHPEQTEVYTAGTFQYKASCWSPENC